MNAMRVGREIYPTTKKKHYHACIQFVSEIRVTTLKQIYLLTDSVCKYNDDEYKYGYNKPVTSPTGNQVKTPKSLGSSASGSVSAMLTPLVGTAT